uniref:Uncharacterized protein n=1 Tax=Oryza nivara TaxID=4536 RepID=A0A0E0GV49_ORYNI
MPAFLESEPSMPRDACRYARPGDLPDLPVPLQNARRSGPLGTLLLLSWKGSSALKSSRVLICPASAAPTSILLPAAIAGAPVFSPPSMTSAINTRTPNKMAIANAAADDDPAGRLIAATADSAVLFKDLNGGEERRVESKASEEEEERGRMTHERFALAKTETGISLKEQA